ncbi:glycosyltransferase [Neoaquamicrobium sediminum]|uniref:glycosyltransferase n=1 Tax=Neoaquamicrobium sediminum TaxID=1849104 RepID=UPI001563EB42|nr:glycosyltransferase [Mesorhizobium sediminum]NRC56205.1 glycosyltransferase [Mesorhizobium sediminum]
MSIVMPCLNGMPYLPSAIESVRKHLPAENVEIIVADGGSTDGSLDFLRGTGVILLEGRDGSLYEGLNKALARARGAHVAWLNCDDTLHEGMAQLLSKARERDADMATGEAVIETESNTSGWFSHHHQRKASADSLLFGVPTINSRIFSRRLIERAGPFRTDVGLSADRYALLRLLSLSPRRVFHPATVYRYRSHKRSRTLARTWHSSRNVHRAHLAMAEVLAAEKPGLIDQDVLTAFECLSRLAAARASLLAGHLPDGLRDALAALTRHPLPGCWLRAISLRRTFGGIGSGW